LIRDDQTGEPRILRIAGLAGGCGGCLRRGGVRHRVSAGYSVPFFNSSQPPSAASIDEAAQPSALCTDFISHFSTDLNTSQSALNAAFQKAIGETLTDQVKNGKLTQAQADKIKQRLAGRTPCAIAGALKHPATGANLWGVQAGAAERCGLGAWHHRCDSQERSRQGHDALQIAAAQQRHRGAVSARS